MKFVRRWTLTCCYFPRELKYLLSLNVKSRYLCRKDRERSSRTLFFSPAPVVPAQIFPLAFSRNGYKCRGMNPSSNPFPTGNFLRR